MSGLVNKYLKQVHEQRNIKEKGSIRCKQDFSEGYHKQEREGNYITPANFAIIFLCCKNKFKTIKINK